MKTLIVAEVFEKTLRKTTLSAIQFARQLNAPFDILVLGEGAESAAAQAQDFGATKVLFGEIQGGYLAENYVATIVNVASGYTWIASTASTFGKDLMPRVAARLNAGYASDISQVTVSGAETIYRRPMYAGNVLGDLKLKGAQHVVTVRQSEFEPAQPRGGQSLIEKVQVTPSTLGDRLTFLSLESVKSARPELTEASIVVSGGRALKSEENFKNVLEPLVDVLNAAMGASRAACDAGYVPNDLQVGQTGKVVAPKLYIAVGISGAIQHLAGMKGSKVIVAINKDKEAPIAQVADYFWAADLFEAVPQLTQAIQKLKAS